MAERTQMWDGTQWVGLTGIVAAPVDYLPLSGGTMVGSINMNGNQISGITNLIGNDTIQMLLIAGSGQDISIRSALQGAGENQRLTIRPGTAEADQIYFMSPSGSVSLQYDAAASPGHWSFANGITQGAGGRVLTAGAVGGVIQRWNGDSDADSGRYYEWRRGDYGWLELFAHEGGVPTMALRVMGGGAMETGGSLHLGLAPITSGVARNIFTGTTPPDSSIGDVGDMYIQVDVL